VKRSGDLGSRNPQDSIAKVTSLNQYRTLKNKLDGTGLPDVVVGKSGNRNAPTWPGCEATGFRVESIFQTFLSDASAQFWSSLIGPCFMADDFHSSLHTQPSATIFVVDLWMQTPGNAGLSPAQLWSSAMAEYAPALPVSATKLNVAFQLSQPVSSEATGFTCRRFCSIRMTD